MSPLLPTLRTRALGVLPASLVAAVLVACGGGGGSADPIVAPQDTTPWGQVALAGKVFADVSAAAPAVVPDAVPLHTVGDAGLHRLDWTMDTLYAPRASLNAPDPRVSARVFLTSETGAASSFVGTFDLTVDVTPVGGAVRHAAVSLLCGGASPSGLFAALRRDAGCDAIAVDWTQRQLRLNALSLAAGQGSLNGTLRFAAHDPAAATTAHAAALRNCTLTPGGAPVALPTTDTAVCLAGTYRGTSDTAGDCSVTIEVPQGDAPRVQVAIEGYAQTYTHLARREGGLRAGTANEQHWTYWFTTAATDGSDPSDLSNPAGASEFVMADFTNLAIFDAAGGPVAGVSFAVAHASAPAGVAGPVDVKFCHVPLAE